MSRVKFYNKEILKKTITCAVIVSSLAFSASSAMAEEISITNGLENPTANSIRNTSYYSSGNILNLDPQSNFEVYGNIYEGSISGVANLIINGNNSLITSKSTNDNLNYGYKITDGSTIQIKDLTFDSFGYKEDVDYLFGSSKYSYGGGLYIQDDKSSVNLSNVSYTNSSLKGNGNLSEKSNFYGAAIANNGSLNISDGVITGGTINATNRWGGQSGGDAYGGAIYNTGNLTLTNVEVSSNSVTSVNNSDQALGGGIYTTKDITLAGGNTFSNNYDSNGNRANDIYFENGDLLVNGNGSDKVNTISSGLASSGNSNIILTDGGKLLLEGDNTDFINGNATVGTDSILTYSGSLENSILSGTTTVNEDGGAVELVVNDNAYNLAGEKIVTSDGVNGQFIKSGSGTLNLTNGDYSKFSGDVIVNSGILNFDDSNGKYINANTNQIAQNATLSYTNANDGTISGISGTGTFDKNGAGVLNITGDNSGFSGVFNTSSASGDIVFDRTSGDKFFANNADVNLSASKLQYTALSSENLNDANFANLNLLGEAIFEYTANSGTTVIDNDFYTSQGEARFVFNGNSNAEYVLNNNLNNIAQVSFNNSKLYFANGLNNITGNLNLNNSTIDVMDKSIKDYTFDNLTAENSAANIDVNLGSNLGSDVFHFTNGNGILNITSLGIVDDDGQGYPKTVQVFKNSDTSNVSLLEDGINPTIAGWSTNVYEYLIDATKSDSAKSYYDSLVFNPERAASPDSLKSMNNYQVVSTRGFSLIQDSDVYHIARDLGQTEYGIFTVNGVSKDESIISGYRVAYEDNGDGTFTYYPDTITEDKGSFFELTDTKGAIDLNINDVTIQDADRTSQNISGGSIIYSNIDNATINIDNAAFKNSHAVGNGGAFDIENADSVNIKDADFSGNNSGLLGGAIYSAVDLNITNSTFSNNSDKDGKNDITLANNADLLFTVEEGKTSNLSSGIKTVQGSSASNFTKVGSGVLNVSGQNAQYTGNININEGSIIFNTIDNNDSFFGYSDNSKFVISNGTSLTINNDANASLSGGHFAGAGNLNINSNFMLYGNNADYTGTAVIDGKSLGYTPENSGDTILGGKIQFLNGAKLWTSNSSSKDYVGGNFISDDSSALFQKSDSGNLTLVGDNSQFTGDVLLNGGSTTFDKTSNTAFFGGDVAVNSTLNYKTTVNDVLNNNISGNGIINKTGEGSLSLNNSTFNGTANISKGLLSVTSQNGGASNLDFVANLSNDATLNYIAGENSSITLGGSNNKLNFLNGANNATANITASNIELDTISNASGNNIILNDANITLNQQNYSGNYTFNNSNLNLISEADRDVKDYTFDSFVSNGSNLTLDVALSTQPTSDKLIVNGGSGVINLSELAIIEDDGLGADKFVQVIQNNNGSSLSLLDANSSTDINPTLAAWSTNVYEYDINAAKSDKSTTYYDGLLFKALAAATPDSLRIMNHERDGLRGFSVVTDDAYNIGKDLDETLAGSFSVNGKDKNTSIISGIRADGYESLGTRGSLFEVVNDTDLTIRNLTIQDALRQNQSIKDGSVVYLNNNVANVQIINSILKDNEAVGNGGAIATNAGNLEIDSSEFSGNIAGALGGAIYAGSAISIDNSTFTGNRDSSGANDIYVASTGVVNFVGSGTSKVESGIAGSGVININDSGTLSLKGNNSNFDGRLNVNSGALDFKVDSSDNSYISGVTNIESGANVNINSSNDTDLNIANGTFTGSGNLNFATTSDSSVILNGDNSGFNGKVNVDSGNLVVNFDSSADKYFSSMTHIGSSANLIFDVADDLVQQFVSSDTVSIYGDGQLVKDGSGTLQVSGDWNKPLGAVLVDEGVLELIKDGDRALDTASFTISNGAVLKVNNQTDKVFNLYGSLTGVEGSTFEIAGDKDSVVDISNSQNSQFFGETLISNGILAFTKTDLNSFVGGSVNIKDSNSKLVYTTDYSNGESISNLSGSGTLDKQGSGELTVNMGDFNGTLNVNSGKFVASAAEQPDDANGQFAFNANVNQDSVLEFNAYSSEDVYNINSDSNFKFSNQNINGTVNFVNGNYNVSSDLENAVGNKTGFENSNVNIVGNSDVSLNGNYALNGNSTLNLANGSVTTTNISSLSTNGTNNVNLDFDFTGGTDNLGSFDVLNIGTGNATLSLNDDSINVLNIANDRGLLVSNNYKVLNGALFANNYSKELNSNLYKYTISANSNSDVISIVASDYVGNTLYTLNHQIDGDRTFHLVGEGTNYYIGQSLDQTLAGTLNITGRTSDRKDTIIGKADSSSDDGLSMFGVVNDNTRLNIQDVTIQNAQSGSNGAVVYQNNSNSNVNITNTTLQNNSAVGNGGAISVENGNMTIQNSSLNSNNAENGALFVNGGTVDITNTVFEGNSADNGGAVYNASGSKNLTMTGVELSNNTAQEGSAIYNLGSATLTDVKFTGNSDSYIYNGTQGDLTITSAIGNYTLTNGNATSEIKNNGILNLTAFENFDFTIADKISGGTINTSGNVILDNVIANSEVNITDGQLLLNGNSSDNYVLQNVILNVNNGNSASLGNKNINDGQIIVNGQFNINNTSDNVISSDLSGSGLINKTGSAETLLTGQNNSDFTGKINITDGVLGFEKTNNNTFVDKNAEINVVGEKSEFDYRSSEVSTNLDDNFANVVLSNGGTVSITGAGRDQSVYTLNNGWVSSVGKVANNLIFNDANYIINDQFNHSSSINDNVLFNESVVSLGSAITGNAITDGHSHDEGALEYDLTGANYTFTNSVLDLSNQKAGDNYNFDGLTFNENSNGISLDINLDLEPENKILPYADTITSNSGSGIVEITKLFITNDNGIFITDADGNQSKGIVRVFKGNNSLQVADSDGVQILSWATNVYKYGVKSASSGLSDGHAQDSIEIVPDGIASTDTLRDMNIYDPIGDKSGGNRGFSFIAKDGLQENNNYNIYRDLDSTSAGTFTVLGTLVGEEKSVLSGKLKNLELLESENTDNLVKNDDNTWSYNGDKIDAKWVTTEALPDGDTKYTIDVRAFSPETETNGSMFEIVNATDFEMSNVSVQDAKRYTGDKIADGSVIYANNADANITLSNVDLINNEVQAGNGGAIANYGSKDFIINHSNMQNNNASGNGGAIYNASEGMSIINANADGNSAGGLGGAIYTSADMTITDSSFGVNALNTHKNGEQNDIYIANNAKVEYISSEGKTNSMNSGLAGEAGTVFDKAGNGALNLNGTNADFNGEFRISSGNVTYTADGVNDSFVSGPVSINKNSTLTMNIAADVEGMQEQVLKNVSGGIAGSGSLVKTGSGSLNLTGTNSNFDGSTTINQGSIIYNAINNSDSYLGGTTNLAGENTKLVLDIDENVENQIVSNVSGVGNSSISKQGLGEVSLSGDNSNFNGTASVNEGKLTYLANDVDDTYINGNTLIADGATLEANVSSQDSEGNEIAGQTIGNISGGSDANFVKTGDGSIQLIGNNNFSGTTTIEQGILAYTSGSGNFVNGNTVIGTNGTLEYSVLSGSDNLTSISGNGGLLKLGSGNLNLVGDNSSFNGFVQIGEGRLSYQTADYNQFINAGAYSIAEGAELYIDNSTSDDINISNLTEYINENNQSLGSGKVIKNGDGTIFLSGDNSDFDGTIDIDQGDLSFVKDSTTNYISGNTEIAKDAVLNYTANVEDALSNVSGSGILNKDGDALLTFDTSKNSVDKSFVANANQGTLNIIGSSVDDFEFNMVANNSATLDYISAEGAQHTVGSNSIVKFGENAKDALINFNSGNYILADDLANSDGSRISFTDSTVNLANTEYNGNYIITDSVIDMINNQSETVTFENLETSDSKIQIDVDLTLPNPSSDKLVSNGAGGALELALNEINLNDTKTDNGLGEQYELNILGGNLTLDKDDTLEYWSTSAYKYKVDIAKGSQDIILTAIKASDENSLKEMNNLAGNRGFQFHKDDASPYIIGESLGETAEGSFVVNGDGSTVISGEDKKSFFELVNDTDLTVKDVTIKDAYSDNGGSVIVANNENSNVTLNNVNISSSSSKGNGGAINNEQSESFVINNSQITNNSSQSLGGAIYTADNMTIVDTDFSGNSDKNGKNDIYVAGTETDVNIYAANKDVELASGIAGDGNINKLGSNDLNLSGKNDDFTGNLNVFEGDINYNQSSATDTYISGNTNIGENNTVTITNNHSDMNTGTFSGTGTLNKEGSNAIHITGDNSNFTGTVNINNGSLGYNTDNAKYFAGTTNINQNGTLAVSGSNNALVSNINGNGTIDKNGSGTLIFQGNNAFNGNMNINEGAFGIASGASIGNIAHAQFASGTGINLQNTSVVDLGDGQFTTNPSPASIENLYFDKLTLLGDVKFDLDVDLKNELADKIGAGTVYGNGNLVLDQGSLNVVSDAILNNTSVQIAYGDLANHVALDPNVTTVMGPIQKYDVSYGNGNLLFARVGGSTPNVDAVNPAVMASSVATQLGGYLTQLQTLNAGFYHMDRYTKYPYMLRLSAENANRNAIIDVPAYNRSSIPETSSAMWVQPYATFEQVNLHGGIGVSNFAYGAMYGGDSNLVDLGHGFKGVLSTFVGYNGSHMSFNGISMDQQGGALGVTGTLYKGNFFTGLTMSAGASAGEAYTPYGTDHFSMITAGVASKTGYNWEIKEGRLIVQPSLFLGYTFANTFDYTNAAGVRIDSDPLNAITISPGVKLIANLNKGWQPYLGVNMVWSIMDKTNVMAQDVRLPQLSVRPYVEYGVGVQKSWGENFTAFFQTMIRNVGRTGIVFTAGFRWSIGKDPKPNDIQKVKKKTVIKVSDSSR